MVVQSSFSAGYSTGALTFICKHENKVKMKDWFSWSLYSGIRRPSGEAEVWEASLLSSSPMLAAEASSAMQKLCSTAARGERKLLGVFQLSLLLEERGKNQQTRGVFLTPVQSFAGICLQCLVLRSVLWWSKIGSCQLQAVPQPLLPLIPWPDNTLSTQVDALGHNKINQTLGSAGNPNAIPDFIQWECIEIVLDGRFIPQVSASVLLNFPNCCFNKFVLCWERAEGWWHKWVLARSCWWGAVPKCSFQSHCPLFKAECWPQRPPELPPILDYHSSPWKELTEEKLPSPEEEQSHSPTTVCLLCTITAVPGPSSRQSLLQPWSPLGFLAGSAR